MLGVLDGLCVMRTEYNVTIKVFFVCNAWCPRPIRAHFGSLQPLPKDVSNEITFSILSKGNFPKVEEAEEEDKILIVGNRG